MNGPCEALKEPIEEVFQKFAYLDLELRPAAREFSQKWLHCTRVKCGAEADVVLLMMCSPELAATVSNNFLGIAEGSRPGQRMDIISELTNVLAGRTYEILRANMPPKIISPPEMLGIREATQIWEQAPVECRYALCSETEDCGGILVFFRDEWSRP